MFRTDGQPIDNIDYVTGIGNAIRRSTPNAGFASGNAGLASGSSNQWLLGLLRAGHWQIHYTATTPQNG